MGRGPGMAGSVTMGILVCEVQECAIPEALRTQWLRGCLETVPDRSFKTFLCREGGFVLPKATHSQDSKLPNGHNKDGMAL